MVSLHTSGQYEAVTFNYDKSFFNEGQMLPAESKFMLNGEAARDVQMVEVRVYETADFQRNPLYTAVWKRHESNSRNTFAIPVNYPLRSNEKYSFLINYYMPASPQQQQQLMKQLEEALWSYLDQSILVSRSSFEMRKHPRNMVSDMNAIVVEGLSFYTNRINYEFTGFSDIVRDKLYQIRKLNLRKAKFNVFDKTDDDTRNLRLQFAGRQIEAIKVLVSKEVAQYANANLLMVYDSRKVVNYSTEKTKSILAVNVGYAGVYNEGSFDDLSSGSAAFAGISIPFGKKAFSAPFWSKASISTGVLLENIDFSETNVATGPIIKRPIYFGLGYRALPFIRLNTGLTVLQSMNTSTDLADLDLDKLYLRPFIGLSIEFDFWLGINK